MEIVLNLFERYLSVWVTLCIVLGVFLSLFFGKDIQAISSLEVANINIPISILIWAMIFPMMLQIDFTSLKKVSKHSKGLWITLVMNWLVKPFTMAFFAWLFFEHIFSNYFSQEEIHQYYAGLVFLGAAPCTAMVFIWSYLTKGNPNYTLVQVSLNDLILLFAYVPIVEYLLGLSNIKIPSETLVLSVLIFIVIPLIAGIIVNRYVVKKKGLNYLNKHLLPKLKPFSTAALLCTLVLIFSFQGDKITSKPLHILIIAIPLVIQTYFIFFLSWSLAKKMKLPHSITSPSAMIGASNFFELAVAIAISIFGVNSGAVLASVVGVLVEVPVMLSLVRLSNKWNYK